MTRDGRTLLDFRGLIALLCIGSVFVYSAVLLWLTGQPQDVPSWMASTSGMVVAYYFGSRTEADRHAWNGQERRGAGQIEAR